MFEYEKDGCLVIDGISELSKSILAEFYKLYAFSSQKTIANAIRRLCEITKINDFSEFTYSSYKLITEEIVGLTTYRLIKSFFQYLYAFEFLINLNGFEKCYWDKSVLLDSYNKRLNLQNKEENDYELFLSIQQVDRIIQYISKIEENDFDNMKLAFSFYALFYLGFEVNELKTFDAKQYQDGTIFTERDEYDIDPHYDLFLKELREKSRTKFYSLNLYVQKLGNIVSISALTPVKIKGARKQFSFVCSQCGKSQLSFTTNWNSVNGQIICNNCAEQLSSDFTLKKNNLIDELINTNLDFLSETEKINIEATVNSFVKLKNEIEFPRDYQEINTFLEKIGKLGEKYVYEMEVQKLKDLRSKYWELVDNSYANDHNNGFDILSYDENGTKKYIEVKTTVGDVKDSFYMSKHELNTSQEIKKRGDVYLIYRVGNILNENVFIEIYDNIDDNNFDFCELVYKVTKKQ